MLAKRRLDECAFLYDRQSELSLEDFELVRERLFSIAASWEAIGWDEIPRCRQVVVPERGEKYRIVTPIEGPTAYLGSMINSVLLATLRCHPDLRSSLDEGDPEVLECPGAVWSPGSLTRSLDLKSASDLLPRDLMDAGIQGFVEGSGLPECWTRILRRLSGDHDMMCSDGEVRRTKRGLLMGSPIAWPFLSLYIAWVHQQSGSGGAHAVVGDDYVGAHSQETNARMDRVFHRTGALFSAGKDYLTTSRFGVLCEELIDLSTRRRWPSLSIRLCVAMPRLTRLRGQTVPRSLVPSIGIGG